jgi:hypothetical protein
MMNRGESGIEDPVDILITGMATNLWAAEPLPHAFLRCFRACVLRRHLPIKFCWH